MERTKVKPGGIALALFYIACIAFGVWYQCNFDAWSSKDDNQKKQVKSTAIVETRLQKKCVSTAVDMGKFFVIVDSKVVEETVEVTQKSTASREQEAYKPEGLQNFASVKAFYIPLDRAKARREAEAAETAEKLAAKVELSWTKGTALEVDDDTIKIIEKVVYAESQGEPFDGKVAVAASFVNRLKQPEVFSDDPNVVLQWYAGINWISEEMLANIPECREAALLAVDGWDPLADILNGTTLYFWNPDGVEDLELKANLAAIPGTYKLGNHVFSHTWY